MNIGEKTEIGFLIFPGFPMACLTSFLGGSRRPTRPKNVKPLYGSTSQDSADLVARANTRRPCSAIFWLPASQVFLSASEISFSPGPHRTGSPTSFSDRGRRRGPTTGFHQAARYPPLDWAIGERIIHRPVMSANGSRLFVVERVKRSLIYDMVLPLPERS